MQNELEKKLFALLKDKREIVICCIGSDLISADCLGPLVGQFLVESNIPLFVYGTMLNPITALNVDEYNDFLRQKHKDSLIIAVDSAIGASEGKISINNDGLIPAVFNKNRKKKIGDVSITAVVSSIPDCSCLNKIRFGQIYKLAKNVSTLIENCIAKLLYTKNKDFAITCSA